MKKYVVRSHRSDHSIKIIESLAAEACSLGWRLISISVGKMGSTSIDQYLIIVMAELEDGQELPPLPGGWKGRER